MQILIFSFLAIVIALGGLWYHDVRHPPEEQAMETKRKHAAEMKEGNADQQMQEPPITPVVQPVAS